MRDFGLTRNKGTISPNELNYKYFKPVVVQEVFRCSSKKNAVFPSFGRGSGLDPASIRSVDPDLDLESGSISRRAKMIHKIKIEKVKKFHVLEC
jgi:hypothetical protein